MHRVLLTLCCALPLCAQDGNFLPLDEFVQDWKISKQFTIAVAQKMPAEYYDFKANPEEMTFGEQMVHLSGALFSRFYEISGENPPRNDPPKKITKDLALSWLDQSFDYVLRVLPKLTPEQLYKKKVKVDWKGRSEVTRPRDGHEHVRSCRTPPRSMRGLYAIEGHHASHLHVLRGLDAHPCANHNHARSG